MRGWKLMEKWSMEKESLIYAPSKLPAQAWSHLSDSLQRNSSKNNNNNNNTKKRKVKEGAVERVRFDRPSVINNP